MLSVIYLVRNMKTLSTDFPVLENALENRSWELIFINDGGPAIDSLGSNTQGIRVINHDHAQGAIASFQEAAAFAAGDTLLFWDSNEVLFPSNLDLLEKYLLEKDAALVAPVTNASHFNPVRVKREYTDFTALQQFVNITAANPALQPHGALIVDTACFLVKKAALEAVNGFNTKYRESFFGLGDLCLRLWQHGHKIIAAENVFVHSNTPLVNRFLEGDGEIFSREYGFNMIYSCTARPELMHSVDCFSEDASILEVGCACGSNFCVIKEQNPSARLYGIEFNPRAAAIAANFAQVDAIDVQTLNHPEWENKFSGIIMGDVLEHLQDPWTTLQNMYKITRPGGRIVISVPNITHISIYSSMLHNQWAYADSGILDRTHLRFFTKTTARELLAQAGYKLINQAFTIAPVSDELLALKEKLLPLLGPETEPADLDAFQWVLTGEKPF